MKATALLSALLLAGPTSPAGPQDRGPKTYTNPIHARNFPDPFVLEHGGLYYAYATASRGHDFQVMESPDLIHWTPRTLDFRVPWSRAHLWAPEVAVRDGTFYLTYSALDGKTQKHNIAIATAKAPLGPFADRGILVRGDDNEVGVIDGHIAFGDGGEAYLFYSEETPRRIVMRALTPDLLGVGPEVIEVVRPDKPWERGVVEAPFVVERGGAYHLFYSGGPFQGAKTGGRYAVGHARADKLRGPYVKTPEPILASVEEQVYGPGHCCLIDTPDGRTWMLYHAWDNQKEPRYGSNPLGRTLRIDRVIWDGDTPRVEGPSLTPKEAPRVGRTP